MAKRIFPKESGIQFVANTTVAEDNAAVVIGGFIFELNGQQHDIGGGTFKLTTGDTIYITPHGLKLAPDKEYPSSIFDNGAVYWLVTKTKDDVLILEVEQ